MYDKIQQGKHVKKSNNVDIDPTNKGRTKIKKQKDIRIQQLNVQVKSN